MSDIFSVQKTGIKHIINNLLRGASIMEKQPVIKTCSVIMEILIVLGLILRSTITAFPQAQSVFRVVTEAGVFSQTLFWIYFGIVLGFLFLLTVSFFWKNNEIVKNSIAFCYVFLQITLLWHQNCSLAIIASTGALSDVLVYTALVPLSIFLLYLQPQLHLFGVTGMLLIVLGWVLPELYWKICLAVVTVFYCLTSGKKLKFSCTIILIVEVWAVCHSNVTVLSVLEVVELGCFILGILLYFVAIQPADRKEKNSFLFELAARGKSLQEERYLTMDQKIKILKLLESESFTVDFQNQLESLQFCLLQNKVSKKQLLDILEGTTVKGEASRWLLAEIEVERGLNVLKTYFTLANLKSQGIKDMLRQQLLRQKAMHCFSSEKVNLQAVKEGCSLMQKFYASTYECLLTFTEFLALQNCQQININKLNQKMEGVMSKQGIMKDCLGKLKRYQNSSQETNMYWAIQKVINDYTEDEEMQKKEEGLGKNYSNYDYVFFVGQQVEKISSKLAVELGLYGKKSCQISHFQIFPEKIFRMITSDLEKYSQKELAIPLLIGNCIMVKRATIHLIPQDGEIKWIMMLNPSEVEDAFLYDYNLNEISAYSVQLRAKFKGNFEFKEINSIPQSILNIDLSVEIFKFNLQKGKKSIDCQFQADLMINSKESKCNLRTLTLIYEYKTEQNNLLLIQAKNRVGFLPLKEQNNLSLSRLKKLKNKESLFANEKIFCKIKNPMEQEVLDLIKNHQKTNVFSSFLLISIFVGLMIVIGAGLLIYAYEVSFVRKQQYTSYIKKGQSMNFQFQTIIAMIYDYYISYYTKVYPTEVTMFNPHLNVTSLLSYYKKSIDSKIQSLIDEQNKNPLSKLKAEIAYPLIYEYHNETGTTLKNGIMSFLAEMKRISVTFNSTFLVKNYRSIRNIQDSYRVGSAVENEIRETNQKQILGVWIFIAIIGTLAIVAYVILIKTKNIFAMIYQYLERISKKIQLQTLGKAERLLRSYPVLRHFDSLRENRCQLLLKNTKKQLIVFSNKQYGNRTIKSQSKFSVVAKNNIFFIFAVFFILLGVGYQSLSDTQSFVNVFKYLQTLQSNSDYSLLQCVDALNTIASKQLYNQSLSYDEGNKISLKSYMDKDRLPSFFGSYKLLETQYLYKDLCEYSDLIRYIVYFQSVDCEKVYSGALKKGFSIVSQLYRSSLVESRDKFGSFKELLDIKQSNETYPIFLQAFYTRRIITTVMNSLLSIFMNTSQEYLEDDLQKKLEVVETASIVFGFFICGVGFSIYFFRQKCKVTFSLLKTIPRDCLLDIKFAKEMIRTNFIQALWRL